jgi:hypothetical protein
MSILFNGTHYHQYPATAFPLSQAARTICFWLNLSDNATLQSFINSVDPTNGWGYQVGLRSSTSFAVWSYGGNALVSANPPAINTWVHIAYTFDGTTHTLYYNGVSQVTSTTAPQTGQPTVCQIGGNQWNENAVNYQMEDMRLYNRALTVNDILTIMNSKQRDFMDYSLLALWPMCEYQVGSVFNGTPAIKETQSNLVATLVGTAYPVAQSSLFLQRR